MIKVQKHFCLYLSRQKFWLRMNHAFLQWICRRIEPSHWVARWLEVLAKFKCKLEHCELLKHGYVDSISRQTGKAVDSVPR